MSATSGMRICRLISPSFSAASRTGTAHRTMSQPAASSDQISSSVACTSRVSVFVIDCTVMGAPPPTLTLPSWICRVLRRLIMSPVLSEELECVDPHQVVVERVDHEQHQQHEAELLCRLSLLERERTTQDRLDDEEEEMPAVQHGHGQEIEHGQVHADEGGEDRQRPESLLGLTSRLGRDLDRPTDIRGVDLPRDQLPEALERQHGHVPRAYGTLFDGGHRPVGLEAQG